MLNARVIPQSDVETRTRQSLGISGEAICRVLAKVLDVNDAGGRLRFDVGCGVGKGV